MTRGAGDGDERQGSGSGRATRGECVEIPQQDGTVRRFPRSALKDAYLNLCERMGADAEEPPADDPANDPDAWASVGDGKTPVEVEEDRAEDVIPVPNGDRVDVETGGLVKASP